MLAVTIDEHVNDGWVDKNYLCENVWYLSSCFRVTDP